MAIVRVKIHPAIGVARVGNSPDEFFVGPERVRERPNPQNGFKDEHCRVKRQAARFRAFAYHDDGSVQELTADKAEIAWTVEVANKKAAVSHRNPGVDPALLTIAPAAVTLTGPQQRKLLDNGTITFDGVSTTVPLGEARTDEAGNLLFLGGFGHSASPHNQPIHSFYSNAGWYDDVCDGPIRATVNIKGQTFQAEPAWVIVAPPKFAPQLDSVITLYDTLFQLAVKEKWLTPPTAVSYTEHVQPILQRARDVRWVTNIGGGKHQWPDPVYDAGVAQHIYGRLRGTNGAVDGDPNNDTMPALAGSAQLTQVQLDLLFAWQAGNFTRDWTGDPQPSAAIEPAGLDRAALEACVGAAFFPGIEAGGIDAVPILDATTFVGAADPLRVNAAVRGPGDLSAFMALPWQADFNACDDGWWPVPRPNWVKVPAEDAYRDWDREVDSGMQMVENWHRLGFVVRQGDELVETERSDVSANVTLLTPYLDFGAVAQGPSGIPGYATCAIEFEVVAQGAPVTLKLSTEPQNPRFIVLTPSLTASETSGPGITTLRFFVAYQTGAALETVQDELQISHVGTPVRWNIGLEAQTVARARSAAALVLDRSRSMAEDAGDGQSKHKGLQEASLLFADLLHEGDGIAVIGYNQLGQRLLGVTELDAPGSAFGPRNHVKNVLLSRELEPLGNRSIGDGIAAGQLALRESTGFARESLVVVTDGNENSPHWISEVAPSVDAATYAVGLGAPENTSTVALQSLTGNHGGYFVSTGGRSADQGLRLKQSFLRIVAELNQTQIALSPQGSIPWGARQALPFQLSEADDAIEVILIAPDDKRLELNLQTPDGFIINPVVAAGSGMTYVAAKGLRFYRISLPTELEPARFDQEGTWKVLLHYGAEQQQSVVQAQRAVRTPTQLRARPGLLSRVAARALAGDSERPRALQYSLQVHVYSRASLKARVTQTSREPGAHVRVSATLLECGQMPVADAAFWADIVTPNGRELSLPLDQRDASGEAYADFQTASVGAYRVRVRARAQSARGHAYQREQLLTAAVWYGADALAAASQFVLPRLAQAPLRAAAEPAVAQAHNGAQQPTVDEPKPVEAVTQPNGAPDEPAPARAKHEQNGARRHALDDHA